MTAWCGRAAPVGLALVLAAGLLLPGLGAAPLDDPGEGQHAEIARETWAEGQWLTLRLSGVRYFDKPPLLYWLGAGSFALWGPSEWAARLAPAMGAMIAVAGTALLGARLLGPSGGFAAAAALLSCSLFFVFGRYVRPETLFVAAIQWGFTGLLLGLGLDRPEMAPSRRWTLVGCAALGLASLAKDPLGLLGPLVAVGIALALAGRLRPVSRWLPATGLGLLLVIGFAWYAAVGLRNPGFWWYTVVDNHLLNAVRIRHFPDEDVPLTSPEFLAIAGLGAFPWIIPASLMMVALLRRRAWRRPEEVPWVALALWAAGLFVVFTALPFKLPHYGLPAYPAIALLAARWWREHAAPARALLAIHLGTFAAIALLCVAAAGSDGRVFSDAVFSTSDVATRKEAVTGQATPHPEWAALRPLVARTAVILGAGSLAVLVAAFRGAGRLGLAAVTATMLLCMPAVGGGMAQLASARAVAGLAGEVRRQMGPGDVLVHEGPVENSAALEFYSGARPVFLDGRRSVLGIGATFPEARERFWDAERLEREWRAGRRILLVTPQAPGTSVIARLPAGAVRLLAQDNGRRLYLLDGLVTSQSRGSG